MESEQIYINSDKLSKDLQSYRGARGRIRQ